MKSVKLLMLGAVVIGLSACNEKLKESKNPPITVEQKMSASALADAGEQLMSPYTFMLADAAFDMALQKDPANEKAMFWKAFNRRLMSMKGILKRAKPLILKSIPPGQKYDDTFKMIPNSPLREFLFDSTVEDIVNPADMLKFFGDYKNAINEFRVYSKKNANLDLTVNMNPHVWQDTIKENMNGSCTATQNPDGGYTVDCDYLSAAQVRVNSADLLVLGQMAAGEVALYSLYTAYDISGLEEYNQWNQQGAQKTDKEQYEKLRSLPGFGKLKQDNTLALIPEIGADMSAAIKWAVKYQKELCAKGTGDKNNRRGFLIPNGICLSQSTEDQRAMALLDQALAGVIKVEQKNLSGQTVQVNRDFFSFARKPVANFLDLIAPQTWSADGAPIGYQDPTLGGQYPDGNANEFEARVSTNKSSESESRKFEN